MKFNIQDMNYNELVEYKKSLEEKQEQIEVRLKKLAENVLTLKQENKPFKTYSLTERNAVFNLSQNAYEWLNEDQNRTIEEYNLNSAACRIEVNYQG